MMCMSHPTPLRNTGGYWTTSWRDDDDNRRWKRFGNVTKVVRKTAQQSFQRWLVTYYDNNAVRNPGRAGLTIHTLTQQYMCWAHTYYVRQDGSPTGEANNIRDALKPLIAMFGDTPADDFTVTGLKAVRQSMVSSGMARTTINQRINKVRAMFKWAASEEMCSGMVWTQLYALKALKPGRGQAKEPDGVLPVNENHIDAALKHAPTMIAHIARIQLMTSARPSEIARMRGCDLDTNGRVWVFKPPRHKTSHHGKTRTIYIGPKAQQIIRPLLKKNLQAYIFDPRDVRKKICGKPVRDHYDRRAYYQAIQRACDKAKVPRWSPQQLRHTAATFLRKTYGEETARLMLGHSKIDTTRLYGELDRRKAEDVIEKIG